MVCLYNHVMNNYGVVYLTPPPTSCPWGYRFTLYPQPHPLCKSGGYNIYFKCKEDLMIEPTYNIIVYNILQNMMHCATTTQGAKDLTWKHCYCIYSAQCIQIHSMVNSGVHNGMKTVTFIFMCPHCILLLLLLLLFMHCLCRVPTG